MTDHSALKLGKLAPACNPLDDPRILKLEPQHLAAGVLPAVPAARDWSLGHNWDSDPLGNDQVGDCTCACLGHLITQSFALAGQPSPITTDGVLEVYEDITGYMPGDPSTDRGAVLRDVLKYVQANGLCGVKIEAFVAVDWTNQLLMAAATDLFGGLIVGCALPIESQSQDTWDVVPGMQPGSWGGHAIHAPANSPALVVFDTWGQRKDATRAWFNACCDEAYAVLIADMPTPSGLNIDQIRADLKALGQ